MTYCRCTQDQRRATGWGFRKAHWSPAGAPIWVIVHYGCDRPMTSIGNPVFSSQGFANRRHWSVEIAVERLSSLAGT